MTIVLFAISVTICEVFAPLATHQSKSDIQHLHNGIQDKTETTTIILTGNDRRIQVAVDTSIVIPVCQYLEQSSGNRKKLIDAWIIEMILESDENYVIQIIILHNGFSISAPTNKMNSPATYGM